MIVLPCNALPDSCLWLYYQILSLLSYGKTNSLFDRNRKLSTFKCFIKWPENNYRAERYYNTNKNLVTYINGVEAIKYSRVISIHKIKYSYQPDLYVELLTPYLLYSSNKHKHKPLFSTQGIFLRSMIFVF